MSRQTKISEANAVIAQKLNDLDGRTLTISEVNLAVADYLIANPPSDIPSKGAFHHGGRVYCYTDNRWISFFDDNYSASTENQSESGGTGVSSFDEWEWQGIPLPSTAILKSLTVIGRSNSTEVTDMEIVMSKRTPNPITRWQTGFDNDAEDTVDTILDTTWWDTVLWSGNMADKHKRVYNLNDYAWDANSELLLSMKPVGAITATRYFYTTWMLEYEF